MNRMIQCIPANRVTDTSLAAPASSSFYKAAEGRWLAGIKVLGQPGKYVVASFTILEFFCGSCITLLVIWRELVELLPNQGKTFHLQYSGQHCSTGKIIWHSQRCGLRIFRLPLATVLVRME